MSAGTILVVGETPSLGRAIADLLESSGFPIALVASLEAGVPSPASGDRPTLVIVASNGYYCAVARRWIRGEFPRTVLVTVGSRDPFLQGIPAIRSVPLPLLLGEFVSLIQELWGHSPPSNPPEPESKATN